MKQAGKQATQQGWRRWMRQQTWIGPVCLLGIIVCNLTYLLGGPHVMHWFVILFSVAFVAQGWREVPTGVVRISALVLGVALVLLATGQAGLSGLERGVMLGAMLTSVVACVTLLARSVLRHPMAQNLADWLQHQSYGRAYGWLMLCGSLLPGVLGFASAPLLMSVAQKVPAASQDDQIQLVTVVTRSFSAASLWSPALGNMAILLSLYGTTVRWGSVALLGILLGAILIGSCLLTDRPALRRAAAQPAPPPAPASRTVLLGGLVLLVGMVAYLWLNLSLARHLALPVSGALAMTAPVVGLLVTLASVRQREELGPALRLYRDDALGMRVLASEVMLFVATGCGGVVLAEAIPNSWVMATAAALGGSILAAVLALQVAMIALSCLGVHPVLSGVFLASTFSPAVLGMPALPHFSALLLGWALASVLTPFSMLNLTAARLTQAGMLAISVRANWRFVVLATVLGSVALTVVSHLMV